MFVKWKSELFYKMRTKVCKKNKTKFCIKIGINILAIKAKRFLIINKRKNQNKKGNEVKDKM